MSSANDASETEQDPAQDWQFTEWPQSGGGGGLLKEILQEVTAIREGAAADRVALAKAISSSFSKLDAEVNDVRGQLATVRSELEGLKGAVATVAATDLVPQVHEAIAAQREILVGDVAAALGRQLDSVRDAIPTEHIARVATEVHQLRSMLLGPD
jgi:hypothetical protein